MRSAGRPRNKVAWFSAPAAMQGRRATVCQADQHLREFWQRSAAVAPVIEPSGDARKQGCRARSAGGGNERGGRGRGGMEAGNLVGAPAASPQPGGGKRQQRDPITRDKSRTRPV